MDNQSINKEALNSLPIPWKAEFIKADYTEQYEALVAYLNDLIQHDFHRLMSLLYRIDVPEMKIRAALAGNEEDRNAGEILAQLMLERQLEKIKTRKQYSSF